MKKRHGKFGEFLYCPNGQHGTISVEKYNKALSMLGINDGLPMGREDALLQAIERQTMSLGGGVLTDTERFFVDNEQYNHDEFWQDVRPY
jgi:hypothetical protein